MSNRVGVLLNMGVTELAGLDLEIHDNTYYQTWSVPEIFVL